MLANCVVAATFAVLEFSPSGGPDALKREGHLSATEVTAAPVIGRFSDRVGLDTRGCDLSATASSVPEALSSSL